MPHFGKDVIGGKQDEPAAELSDAPRDRNGSRDVDGTAFFGM